MLDSLGNTTAATGKGFAIGSAALTALALFAAFVQVVQTQITTQAQSFEAKAGYTVPAEITGPYAVYEGHHRFAIVDPAATDGDKAKYVDGGMIVDRVQLNGTHFDESVEVGDVFALQPLPRIGVHTEDEATTKTARRFMVTKSVGHEDHGTTLKSSSSAPATAPCPMCSPSTMSRWPTPDSSAACSSASCSPLSSVP
jgi:hypothetical protein